MRAPKLHARAAAIPASSSTLTIYPSSASTTMSVAALSRSPYSSSHLPAALEQGSNQLVPGSPISPATAASLRLAAATRSRSPSQFVPEVERSNGYAVSPLLRHVLKVGHVQQLNRKRHSGSPSPNEHSCKRLRSSTSNSPQVPIFLSQNGPSSPSNQDQVVPESKGGDTRREHQRSLPTFSKEGTKVLDLFQGDDIFASREE